MSPTIQAILVDVSAITGVHPDEIMSELRTRPVSRARAVAIHVAREVTLWSYSRLGRTFDKDHTSIINSCRRIHGEMARDPDFAIQVNALIERHQITRLQPGGAPLDAIEIARPIAGGSDRAAIQISVRQVTMLAQALMQLWDVALAAEVYVEHVSSSHSLQDDTPQAQFARALGRAITEEIDAIRIPIAHPYDKEQAA